MKGKEIKDCLTRLDLVQIFGTNMRESETHPEQTMQKNHGDKGLLRRSTASNITNH